MNSSLDSNAIYQNMVHYGIWYKFKLETLTQEQKVLLGIKLFKFSPVALNHLNKLIRKIGTDYSWSLFPNGVLAGLVECPLLGCVALIFSLWLIMQLHSCVKWFYPNINHPHMLIEQNQRGQHSKSPKTS